ncbi:MAG TPA: DUF1507 family protein [Bacillales bacterium]|nr:DUF1507 family protein [Bacillales bacterium]
MNRFNRLLSDNAIELLRREIENICNMVKCYTSKTSTSFVIDQKSIDEIVDTHVFGFSKSIRFAIIMNMISEKQGNCLKKELESKLEALVRIGAEKDIIQT